MSDPPVRVLVVDDTESNRYLFTTWLNRAGYQVEQASTGYEALSLLDRTLVDLVLLDICLPDQDGYQVCQRVKANPQTSMLPVVHISATEVDWRARTHGLRIGADAYLTQPVEPDEFVATIAAVLRHHRPRQQAEQLASRLSVLARATLAVAHAADLESLLLAAARAMAEIFGGAALASAARPGGGGLCLSLVNADAAPVTAELGRAAGWLNARFEEGAQRVPADWLLPVDPALAIQGEALCHFSDGGTDQLVLLAVATDLTWEAGSEDILAQLCQAIQVSVEALWLQDEERHVALTVQRSLLPHRLPELTGLTAAVRYLPAVPRAGIGGDFYELLSVGDRALLVIGDVGGHSVHASTVMAELRHALRAYAMEGYSPARILDRLNQLMLSYHPEEIATACLVLADPVSGRLEVANAGHLPPLLVSGTGGSSFVDAAGPLLGLDAPRPDPIQVFLPRDSTLVMVTDGLIERRTESLTEGMRRLQATAERQQPNLESYCDQLLQGLVPAERDDDVALVVVRRH